MENLYSVANVKRILLQHGIKPLKKMGQNFIINPGICPKMAELCGLNQKTGILEIGPGLGTLTRELALRAKKVLAVELDRRLLPILEQTLQDFDNVNVICSDIQKTDIKKLLLQTFGDMNVCVCANLPYYITSPIIMKFLEERVAVKSLTFMLQKEAARRICALPGTREVGAISFAVRYFAKPERLFSVSRGSFFPVPNVDSEVIRLSVREEPLCKLKDERVFFAIVKAAFSQRRKTLANALSCGLKIEKELVEKALGEAGLKNVQRIEQLRFEDVGRLADIISIFIKLQ